MGDKTNAPFQIDFNVTAEPIVINGTTLIPNERDDAELWRYVWVVGGRVLKWAGIAVGSAGG